MNARTLLFCICIIVFLLLGIFFAANIVSFQNTSSNCLNSGGICMEHCGEGYISSPNAECEDDEICCIRY